MEAFNPTEVSPIASLEPILCDICIQLGKMGRPLTKTTVIKLHLKQETPLGTAWYHGFLNFHAALLTTSGTMIKDVKRRTWVTSNKRKF